MLLNIIFSSIKINYSSNCFFTSLSCSLLRMFVWYWFSKLFRISWALFFYLNRELSVAADFLYFRHSLPFFVFFSRFSYKGPLWDFIYKKLKDKSNLEKYFHFVRNYYSTTWIDWLLWFLWMYFPAKFTNLIGFNHNTEPFPIDHAYITFVSFNEFIIINLERIPCNNSTLRNFEGVKSKPRGKIGFNLRIERIPM